LRIAHDDSGALRSHVDTEHEHEVIFNAPLSVRNRNCCVGQRRS
jgi:hypothetical protein